MIQVLKNIGMVKFHAGQHGHRRSKMHELGAFVEKCGVILIAFDDHVVSATQPEVAVEVLQNPTNHKGRVQSGFVKHPGQNRRGGRFAVSAGDHKRFFILGDKAVQCLGHGAKRDSHLLHFFYFRILAGDRIADNHQIQFIANVRCIEAVHDMDAPFH